MIKGRLIEVYTGACNALQSPQGHRVLSWGFRIQFDRLESEASIVR